MVGTIKILHQQLETKKRPRQFVTPDENYDPPPPRARSRHHTEAPPEVIEILVHLMSSEQAL